MTTNMSCLCVTCIMSHDLSYLSILFFFSFGVCFCNDIVFILKVQSNYFFHSCPLSCASVSFLPIVMCLSFIPAHCHVPQFHSCPLSCASVSFLPIVMCLSFIPAHCHVPQFHSCPLSCASVSFLPIVMCLSFIPAYMT